MGNERQKDYTPVNGLAIAAMIARALPAKERARVMARMNQQSPVTAVALEASMSKVELQIQEHSALMARQISKQLALPERKTQVIELSSANTTAVQSATEKETEEASDTDQELSPAEILLQEREGSHGDLEKELQRQRPVAGRRRIISA